MADQRRGGISWTEDTWNVIRGCRRKNKDCLHCYAELLAATRLAHQPKYIGLATMTPSGPRWTGKVRLDEDDLLQPLRWRRSRLIFVNAMSDFFYEDLADRDILRMIAVMALAHWHRYQVLTKRPERMLKMFSDPGFKDALADAIQEMIDVCTEHSFKGPTGNILDGRPYQWPLPHVWWGASMGHQEAADEFMPLLMDIRRHAAVLWVSAEPLIGHMSLRPWLLRKPTIDWLVTGGESNKRDRALARPMMPSFARLLRDQATDAGVAFHHKQNGEWGRVTYYEIGGYYMTDNRTVVQLPDTYVRGDGDDMVGLIGRAEAGRLLDGKQWDEYPANAA